MPHQGWDHLYRRAYERGRQKLAALRGVTCAFHSVMDGFIRLTPEVIHPVLERDPELKRAALEGCMGSHPLEIHSPSDFITGLFSSLSRGAALQLMIRSESVYTWALETFGPGELRLGGTSANMARSLAPLRIPVTVYANPLTRELASLFGYYPNLFVIARRGDAYVLLPPREAADESGVFAIHWVMEYAADFAMEVDGVSVAPRRANRYIPSWNPRNNQFKMSEEFAEGFLANLHRYSHLLFSGFHILSERYPDGSTCEDVVRPLGDYLGRVRAAAPELKIHLEMASIASPRVRDVLLRCVIPHVGSLGLNETELPLLLESIHPGEVALDRDADAFAYGRALLALQDATGLARIHFHNLGYYLCFTSGADPENVRDALLFAAILAAARARRGLFSAPGDIAAGLEEPLADIGFEQLHRLGAALHQPALLDTGLGEWNGRPFAMIPTRLVNKPLFTVGLGDTISSGAFLTE